MICGITCYFWRISIFSKCCGYPIIYKEGEFVIKFAFFMKCLIVSFCLLISVQTYAALGQLRILSSLGQPLHVEIPITGSTGRDVNAIRIGMVKYDDMLRKKIFTRKTSVGELNFKLEQKGKDRRVLVITSDNIVKEPIFKFAIQAFTTSGNSVIEYTVNLSPSGKSLSFLGTSVNRSFGLYHKYNFSDIDNSAISLQQKKLYNTQIPTQGKIAGFVPVNLTASTPMSTMVPAVTDISEVSNGVNLSNPSSLNASDIGLIKLEERVKARDELLQQTRVQLNELKNQVTQLKQKIESADVAKPSTIQNDETPSATGLLDLLLNNILLLVGAVLFVGVAVIAVLKIRLRKYQSASEDVQALTLNVGSFEPQQIARSEVASPKTSPKPLAFNQSALSKNNNAAATFMTDFTQMSGAIDTGEVDPIAEAEVYIAYGRDAQAEEILFDALVQDPARHEVRMKLMELYASKSDVVNFGKLAKEMHDVFDGSGALWAKAAAMGMALDPENPLYQIAESPEKHKNTNDQLLKGNGSATDSSLDEELANLDFSATSDYIQQSDNLLSSGTLDSQSAGSKTNSVEDITTENDDLLSALISKSEDNNFLDTRRGLQKADKSSSVVTIPDEFSEEHAELMENDSEKETENELDFSLDSVLSISEEDKLEPVHDELEELIDNELAPLEFNIDLEEGYGADDIFAVKKTNEDFQKEEHKAISEEELIDINFAVEGNVDHSDTRSLFEENENKHISETSFSSDSLNTKLDLAQVYIDMGDGEGAKEVLQELMTESHDEVIVKKVRSLLASISS